MILSLRTKTTTRVPIIVMLWAVSRLRVADWLRGYQRTRRDRETETNPRFCFVLNHYVTFQKQPGEHPGRAVI